MVPEILHCLELSDVMIYRKNRVMQETRNCRKMSIRRYIDVKFGTRNLFHESNPDCCPIHLRMYHFSDMLTFPFFYMGQQKSQKIGVVLYQFSSSLLTLVPYRLRSIFAK